MKNVLARAWPLMLVPMLAYCATLINFNQIAVPSGSGGQFVAVDSAGTKLVTVPAPSAGVPSITVTVVTSNTPNAFPIPPGRTVPVVTRGIAQSPGVDYDIVSGNFVFRVAPNVGDVVQLTCF